MNLKLKAGSFYRPLLQVAGYPRPPPRPCPNKQERKKKIERSSNIAINQITIPIHVLDLQAIFRSLLGSPCSLPYFRYALDLASVLPVHPVYILLVSLLPQHHQQPPDTAAAAASCSLYARHPVPPAPPVMERHGTSCGGLRYINAKHKRDEREMRWWLFVVSCAQEEDFR